MAKKRTHPNTPPPLKPDEEALNGLCLMLTMTVSNMPNDGRPILTLLRYEAPTSALITTVRCLTADRNMQKDVRLYLACENERWVWGSLTEEDGKLLTTAECAKQFPFTDPFLKQWPGLLNLSGISTAECSPQVGEELEFRLPSISRVSCYQKTGFSIGGLAMLASSTMIVNLSEEFYSGQKTESRIAISVVERSEDDLVMDVGINFDRPHPLADKIMYGGTLTFRNGEASMQAGFKEKRNGRLCPSTTWPKDVSAQTDAEREIAELGNTVTRILNDSLALFEPPENWGK